MSNNNTKNGRNTSPTSLNLPKAHAAAATNIPSSTPPMTPINETTTEPASNSIKNSREQVEGPNSAAGNEVRTEISLETAKNAQSEAALASKLLREQAASLTGANSYAARAQAAAALNARAEVVAATAAKNEAGIKEHGLERWKEMRAEAAARERAKKARELDVSEKNRIMGQAVAEAREVGNEVGSEASNAAVGEELEEAKGDV